MNYNVTTGKKLVIGYKYDAGGDSIVFTGYTKKEDESVVYLKFYNGENYLIPLVDMAVEIGSPLTDKTGVFPMQLVEILDGALIKNSPVWYGVVKNSLDQSTVTEVTTPELNLVYAQMYEAYQNILEIQETLVTAQNFDDMMAEYLEDHTIPVGVTSVNGLYGDVVLGAGQVGAIPAETVTQEDTTSSAAPGSQGTFEAVSEVYRNEYGQVIGVDTVTVTMPTIPAETSRTDTTSTARANVFSVIDEIETNEYGHVTAVNTKTVTVPSSGGGGGGTGAGEFVITVTKSGNTYTADRTGEEIQAAMEDGLVPILLEASNAVSGLAYHLSTYNQNLWVFDRPMSATKVAEFVLQGATPTITYTELTQTVDNALSSTSTNPVQNQAITTAISGLTADDIQDDSTVTTSGTVKDALRALSDEIANKGTYSKPSGGIPKSDLASAVQTSLEKADTALQTAPVSSVNGKTGAVTGLEEATTIVTKTSSDTSQTLAANTFYVWPTMTTLTVTCPTTGGPYAFRFTSGSTATTLTMSGITMPDDFTVEANKVYEINVYQGYGLAASWAVS